MREGAGGERRDKPNKIVNKALSWYLAIANDTNEKKVIFKAESNCQ